MESITEPERKTPVVRDVEVVVAGGGPAGIMAAAASARAGARTLLAERYGYLGGMITGCRVVNLYGFGSRERQYVRGLAQELVARLGRHGAWRPFERRGPSGDGATDVEAFKWVAAEMVLDSGAEILLHSWVVGAVMDGRKVAGVITESKSGREAVLARVTVDATADGDVAHLAGAACRTRDDYDSIDSQFGRGKLPNTLGAAVEGVDKAKADAFKAEHPEEHARLERELDAACGGTDLGKARTLDGDATDARELTRMEIESRRRLTAGLAFLRERMPGWEGARLVSTEPQLGVREGRRIVGLYTICADDMAAGRKADDGVCRCWSGSGGAEYDIPYRCLVPEEVDGLLASGRCISMAPDAMETLRLVGPCMATGQAAGVAAALSAARDVPPRDVDTSLLRGALEAQGVLL